MSQTPQQDFLKSISSLLRVSPQRRELLMAELEDHLEFRRAELAAKGYTGEELDRASLYEFGDPGQLAAGLTAASHRQSRRKLMRYTLATSAGIAVSLLAGASMWHNARGDAPVAGGTQVKINGPGAVSVAQNTPPGSSAGFSAIEDQSEFPGGRFVPSQPAQSNHAWFELVQNQPNPGSSGFGAPGIGAPGGVGSSTGAGGEVGGGGNPFGAAAGGEGARGGGAAPGFVPPGGGNASGSPPGLVGADGSAIIYSRVSSPGNVSYQETAADKLVREKLNTPLSGMSFTGVQAREALMSISEAISVDIFPSKRVIDNYFQNNEINNLTFKFSQPTALSVLKMILDELDSNQSLTIVVRDGAVRIIDAETAQLEVRVYNCRDLLNSAGPAIAQLGNQNRDFARADRLQETHYQIDRIEGENRDSVEFSLVSQSAIASDDDGLVASPNADQPAGEFLAQVAPAGAFPGAGGGASAGPAAPDLRRFLDPQPGAPAHPAGSGLPGGATGTGPLVVQGPTGGMGSMSGGGMMGSGMGSMGGGGFGGMGGGGFGGAQASRQAELLNTIQGIVAAQSPQENAGMHFFDGLLVVNGSPRTHEKVANLLRLLREASQQPAVTAPVMLNQPVN